MKNKNTRKNTSKISFYRSESSPFLFYILFTNVVASKWAMKSSQLRLNISQFAYPNIPFFCKLLKKDLNGPSIIICDVPFNLFIVFDLFSKCRRRLLTAESTLKIYFIL